MLIDRSWSGKLRGVIIHIVVIVMGFACLLPMMNIISISLSGNRAVLGNNVGIWPVGFTLNSYRHLLDDTQVWRSFSISVLRVVLALSISIPLIILMAYPLSKTQSQFPARKHYMKYIIFALLFSGGMIPTFIIVNRLRLVNTIFALVLPGAVPIFNIILMKNFFSGIPKSLEEAATIDGASPFKILLQVYLPCSLPVLATISLFVIVGHWNDFFGGLVYMMQIANYPLMTYIQTLTINIAQIMALGGLSPDELERLSNINNRNLDSAKIVLAAVPLMAIYPFLQKYFITGIVVGAVKE